MINFYMISVFLYYLKRALLDFHPSKGVSRTISFTNALSVRTEAARKLMVFLDPKSTVPDRERLFSKN
jgi:hypothetical protein